MDDGLPTFEPIGPAPVISDAERLHARQIQPENPEIAKAEALCLTGDVDAATVSVTKLLQTGTQSGSLQFCLLGAVLSKSVDLVRMLLDAGVPVNLVNIKPAIENRSQPILSLFLQQGWDINEPEQWCLPPLLSHAMATGADEPLVSWFLGHGADPNARCQMDITPLSTAAGCAPFPIVKQLLAHCPPSTSFQGELLHWAARRQSDDADQVVRLILERCQPDVNGVLYKADPFSYELQKVTGLGTALHEVAKMGQPSVAELLLQTGTDISIRDSCGNTALETARQHENHAVTELLWRAEKVLAPNM